ncbi:MAG TPA: response regulator [Blastocatellia bacterium]|nr:response regulator [Blastocatellia bacterium]
MSEWRILIAEDHQDTRELIQMVIESAGYVVIAKEDGAEALDYLTKEKPAVIVTDLMMPRVSGIELIKQVRRDPELRDIPVIAMSAFGGGELRQAREAGATEIVKKTGDFAAMVSKITEFLS